MYSIFLVYLPYQLLIHSLHPTMKSIYKFALCCLGIAIVALSGCSEKKPQLIGVSQCSSDDWRNKMNDEICCEALSYPQYDVIIRNGNSTNETQIEQLRELAAIPCDIILVAPYEEAPLRATIDSIFEAGIPVIVFDRGLQGSKYTTFQGTDNVEIGKCAARTAYKLLCNGQSSPQAGLGNKVIEIWGIHDCSPAQERHFGFNMEAGNLGLEIVAQGYGNWTGEMAGGIADSLLREHPEANLIFAQNDRMAIAAAKAAQDLGRKNMKIIGVDGVPYLGVQAVADGLIDATIPYPTDGYRLLQTAISILKGKEVPKATILPVLPAVDKTNVDSVQQQYAALRAKLDK